MSLRLVKPPQGDGFLKLIDQLTNALSGSAEVCAFQYGTGLAHTRSLGVYVYANTNSQMRIIYDPSGRFYHRQGVHTVLEDNDLDTLLIKIDKALDDCFDTIWIH